MIHSLKNVVRAVGTCFSLAILVALPAQARKINVITATTDLAALTQEVAGDKVDVESIAKGYQDPHYVEAKPSFLLKLRHADLLVVVGLDLEIGWLPPLMAGLVALFVRWLLEAYWPQSLARIESWRFRHGNA